MGASPQAIALYEGFHKEEPRRVGAFPSAFSIPDEVVLLGDADFVLYRSRKRDPLTYRKPAQPIDYIHEHDGGVKAYTTDKRVRGARKSVPKYIQNVGSLVLLGQCIGFGYFRYVDDDLVEVEGRRPYPELCAIPSGKALLAIQDKRHVLAMIWGGKLGVEPRGIVH